VYTELHYQFSAGMQVFDFFFFFFMFHSTSYYPELDFYYCFLIVDYYCLQTVAVIPVLPHGVVQFGSLLPVSLSQAFCSFLET